jgi:sulfite reductase (NADPH) flavoprotein alpha-component
MTVREIFAPGSLTLEQWQHVEQLGRTLSPEQARWLSGYFAGLDAGMLRAGSGAEALAPQAPVAAGAATRTLTILYASETGNSAELAKALSVSAIERGLSAQVFDVAHYKPRRLKDEQDLLVIASTHGEGDPPQSAVEFFEFVEGHKAPRLDSLRFSVLALGDSSYELYCEGGKRLDRRFEELGATRLHPRVDCDVDYDDQAAEWSIVVLDLLAREEQRAGAAIFASAASAPAPALSPHGKRNPFEARIVDNIAIVGKGSTKETRHIEIDISGSGLAYEPGDALGVGVRNDPRAVAGLLEALRIEGSAPITVKERVGSLGEALERDFEIGIATPRFLDHWAGLTGASALGQLLGEERAGERAAFLHAHNVIDIVREFPVEGIDSQTFVAGLRPLQPRLYSIASSLAAVPDEAHLTLSPVRYSLHGDARSGVASGHLADRGERASTLPVYVQSNPHFRLPGDDVPIVMVGAGTGVAPYRAFLQEREARGAKGKSWLFFGERNFRHDFLYQTEWQAYLADGLLSRMDVAFSRDLAGKVYVQQRMREQARDLYAWLQEGAHIYVCGDAANMAPDVHEALIEIVGQEGAISREAAEEQVRTLQRDQRYQRDVY